MIYDDMVADVTVKVTQEIGDTTNALVSSVVYPEDTTFDNHIKELKDAHIDLNLSKSPSRPRLKENEFTFNLRDEKGQLLATATNDKRRSCQLQRPYLQTSRHLHLPCH